MSVAYSPHLATQAPMQALVKHTDGNLYLTQADGGTPYETVTLSRVNSSGALLDSMVLTNAGHGFFLSIEDRSGVPWIWTTWKEPASGGYTDDIVRFPYTVGTFDRTQLLSKGFEVMFSSGGSPQQAGVSFNSLESKAVIQFTGSGYVQFQQADKASLLTKQMTASGNTIFLFTGPPTVQGATSYGDSLFVLTGASTTGTISSTDPPVIREYSWSLGYQIGTYDLQGFGKETGSYVGGYMELEGAAMESSSGSPRLLAGVTLGTVGSRVWRVYGEDLATMNRIVSYNWEFGDGATSSEVRPTHAYAKSGNYSVKLTVTDRQGQTSVQTHSVTV